MRNEGEASRLRRFWARVSRTETCWLWTGTKTSGGYGQIEVRGRKIYVHRFAYELLIGPIPEGLVLDHVKARGCTSTLCVNPAHLEPVTQSVNMARANEKPMCFRGHVRPSGLNDCPVCKKARRQAYYQQTGR